MKIENAPEKVRKTRKNGQLGRGLIGPQPIFQC